MTHTTNYDPEVELLWRKVDGAQVRSVAVVAGRTGEGATTIALTLARRAATAGASVLLVDLSGDGAGSAQALGMQAEPEAIVTLPGTRLAVLGRPSVAQALAWREPAQLIAQVEQWRDRWDLVVFDAPPVLPRTPGAMTGAGAAMAAEGTVLVTLAGRTPAPVIRDAWNRLEGAGAKLLGAVMNDRDNPSLLAELEREADRLAKWLPRLMAALRVRLHRATLLSVRV